MAHHKALEKPKWFTTNFLGITDRGIVGPGGVLIGEKHVPISEQRKVRIRQFACEGMSHGVLRRRFSISQDQLLMILEDV